MDCFASLAINDEVNVQKNIPAKAGMFFIVQYS